MDYTPTDKIDLFADPNTAPILLPGFMIECTNIKQVRCYRIALKMAMHNFLSDEQRELIQLHYWQGMSKTNIARKLGTTTSTICKRLAVAKNKLYEHIDFAVRVYTALERLELEVSE